MVCGFFSRACACFTHPFYVSYCLDQVCFHNFVWKCICIRRTCVYRCAEKLQKLVFGKWICLHTQSFDLELNSEIHFLWIPNNSNMQRTNGNVYMLSSTHFDLCPLSMPLSVYVLFLTCLIATPSKNVKLRLSFEHEKRRERERASPQQCNKWSTPMKKNYTIPFTFVSIAISIFLIER